MKLAKESIDIGILARRESGCLRFYCEQLGFPKLSEARFADRTMHRIQIGGSLLKLHEFDADAPPRGPSGMNAQAGIRYVTIFVEDLDATRAELEGKGVKLGATIRAPSGALVALTEDPEGNVVEFSTVA